MNDARGTTRGAGGEVVGFEDQNALPGAGALASDRDSINAATDDRYVEVLAVQTWP